MGQARSRAVGASAAAPPAEEPPAAGRLLHGCDVVGVQGLALADELRSYLAEEEGCASAEAELPPLGFQRCVDYPSLPGHVYYEGYFHALASPGAISSVHPRLGHDFEKPAAPLRLRAFAEAVRRVNAHAIDAMAAATPRHSTLRDRLTGGCAFGDLAIQVHCGDEVGAEHVAWHVDSSNSCLHMAVSILGSRTLRMKVAPDASSPRELLDVPQRPGSVYVGNPAAYVHGVEYPAADWQGRIVACQFRLLLSQADVFSPTTGVGMEGVARVIAQMALRMPSLQEVLCVAAELGGDLRKDLEG